MKQGDAIQAVLDLLKRLDAMQAALDKQTAAVREMERQCHRVLGQLTQAQSEPVKAIAERPGAPFDDGALLTAQEAAEFLDLSWRTLERARVTGQLCGRPGPPYKKFGARMVRYDRRELAAWLAGIPSQKNTGQDPQ